MPLPRPVRNVPREEVGQTVDDMLVDPAVKNVDCVQQDDGLYTVTPHDFAGEGPG